MGMPEGKGVGKVDEFAAQWVNRLLEAADDYLEDRTKAAVFAACSEACTAPWVTAARQIREEAHAGPGNGTVAALLDAFRQALPSGGPEVSMEDGAITWQFAPPVCPCPLAALTQNPALCRCGTAHVKGMLEALLGQQLDVNLVGSRLRGDAACAYRVRQVEGHDLG
jgi:predicted ArsR family transcriptional regulator